MTGAMVTGRMSSVKKAAGNAVLKELGITASQAINDLYSYLIEHGRLPFESETKTEVSPQLWAEAAAFADSLSESSRFSHMTDDEIRAERLASKGLSR